MMEVCHSSPPAPIFAASVLPLAHSGHWLVNLMYMAPVVGFLGWLGVITVRERREEKAGERRQRKRSAKER